MRAENNYLSDQAVWPVAEILDPQFFTHVPNAHFYTLGNGMKVLLMQDSTDRSCKFELYVNAGALHQTAIKRGVPHFTEHMVFRATEKFADNEEITEYAQEYNLDYNGSTGNNRQNFYVESDAESQAADAAANMLSQIVLHPTLPRKFIETERQIVYSEQQAGLSQPEQVAYDEYQRHFHSGQHPLGGGGIIGEAEVIVQYSHEDVVNFYQQFFFPENMTLVVSGGLPESELRTLIDKYFDVSQGSRAWVTNPLLGQSRDTNPENKVAKYDFNHVTVSVGRYLPKPAHLNFPSSEYFALKVAEHALSTRVFLDVREKQGLAYSVYAHMDNLQHGYFFTLAGEFPKDKYQQGKIELEKYIDNLLTKPITQDEFKRGLRKLKSTRWADNTKAIAGYVGYCLFNWGQLVSPEWMQAHYNELTLEKVNAAIQKVLPNMPVETILVGPQA